MQMGLRIISNKCCDYFANVMNGSKCLHMGLQTLQTYLWMMRMSCQCCHFLAICLRMMRIFDEEAAIGINTRWIWRWAYCFLEFKKRNNSGKTFARNGKRRTLQTPCKCLTNVSNRRMHAWRLTRFISRFQFWITIRITTVSSSTHYLSFFFTILFDLRVCHR